MSVQIAYTALTIIMVIIILVGYYKALQKSGTTANASRNKTLYLLLAFLAWFIYLHFVSQNYFLYNFSFPPRFPLLVFIPTLLCIIFVPYINRNSPLVKALPKSWPVYYQTFRIFVEITIYYTFIAGIIPIQTTFEGYNYDILIGLTAPIIGYLAFQKKWLSEHALLIWNIVGILVLASVIVIAMTSFFAPQLWGSETPLIAKEFTILPYLLLASFLAPSALFMHSLSIVQLLNHPEKSQ